MVFMADNPYSAGSMGSCMTLASCIIVFYCLLHTAASEHRKKIIIKYPHKIKHIHHDHYKPIHIHKVHSKSVEHHHGEHKEIPNAWKDVQKKTRKGKGFKIHGSFSNLKPVFLQDQTVEEQVDYPEEYEHQHDFEDKHRVGLRLDYEQAPEETPGQDNGWKLEARPHKRRSKLKEESFDRHNNFNRQAVRLKPNEFSNWDFEDFSNIDFSGEERGESNEHSNYFPNEQRISRTRKFSKQENRNRKSKNLSGRSQEISPVIENDGWNPMVDFRAWRNFNIMDSNLGVNQGEHVIDSGQGYLATLSEDLYYHPTQEEDSRRKKRKQKRQKKQKLSKKYEYNENLEDHDRESVDQSYSQQPLHIGALQSSPIVQTQSQLIPPLQIHQIQPPSIHNLQEHTSWSQQQMFPQQLLPSVLQPQAVPEAQPTQASNIIWSGHHLQMPDHTMWLVQQHSGASAPLQMLTFNSNPLQALQVHQPNLLPPQLTQESSLVQQVASPGWPLTQKTQGSPVKQQWEQHVQTSGSDGPASSYRVEVINYTKKKSAKK